MDIEREKIDFDVLFVGGGPANLAGAIRLIQLAGKKNMNLEPLNGYNLPFLKIATRSHIPMIAAVENNTIPIKDIP